MVRHTALISAAAAGAATLLLVACGSSTSSVSSPSSTPAASASTSVSTSASSTAAAPGAKLLGCMVTDTGGINDKSFNQLAWQGMQEAAAANPNITVKYLQSTTQSDYVPNINSFLSQKCGIIVTVGFLMAAATESAAKAQPSQSFAIVDCSYASECLSPPKESNIDQLVFNTVQD